MDLSAAGCRSQDMKRRAFLVAAAAPLVAGAVPERLLAAVAGGGVVAVVTADLESHLVAVDTSSGRIVKRIPVSPGPRSIESNGFGQALVAHTGVRPALHPRCRHAHGRRARGRARGAALCGNAPDGAHRLRQRVEARCGSGDRSRPLPGRRPGTRSGPARHLSLSADGLRLWVALGTKATHVAVLDVSAARSPRLVRTIQPPFLAHDVVWAPGDEHVWVTSGARSELAVYARDARAPLLRLPRAPRRSTSRSWARAPTWRAARTDP